MFKYNRFWTHQTRLSYIWTHWSLTPFLFLENQHPVGTLYIHTQNYCLYLNHEITIRLFYNTTLWINQEHLCDTYPMCPEKFAVYTGLPVKTRISFKKPFRYVQTWQLVADLLLIWYNQQGSKTWRLLFYRTRVSVEEASCLWQRGVYAFKHLLMTYYFHVSTTLMSVLQFVMWGIICKYQNK